jgi:hypothetical protein
MNGSKVEVVSGAFEYNDGLYPGGRKPTLFLVAKDGSVHVFNGRAIPAVANVEGERFTKNGKWSNTTYRLRVASAVPVHLLAPLHGKVWDAEGTWGAGWAAWLSLVPHTDRKSWEAAVRATYPGTAARWDAAAVAPALE